MLSNWFSLKLFTLFRPFRGLTSVKMVMSYFWVIALISYPRNLVWEKKICILRITYQKSFLNFDLVVAPNFWSVLLFKSPRFSSTVSLSVGCVAAYMSSNKFRPVSSVILYDMKPEVQQRLILTVQVRCFLARIND